MNDKSNEDKLSVICDECGKRHEATYSHEGRFNQGAIFAVVCDVDGLTDYYTSERVEAESFDAAAQAEIIARVTGSRSATVTHERRLPSGELVVDDAATFGA